jgi:hypothetical protein
LRAIGRRDGRAGPFSLSMQSIVNLGFSGILPLGAILSAMSALGHKQTYALQQTMSALPPLATAKADMPTNTTLLV